MNRSFIVDSTFDNMRLDRYLRNKLGKIPQSLIEKSLRSGKIKLNKKKVKSSFKVRTNDKIDIFNLNFKENIIQKKRLYNPSNELTPGMLLTLGEQNILKLSDFADLASDELTGSYDEIKGEKVKIRGYLEDFALSKKEADELIMSARDIVYQDWEMKNGKEKIKVDDYWSFQKNDK